MNDVERIHKLANILASYAKTNDEIYAINVMVKNNASVKDYVYALTDGLKYGNWPWIQHSKFKGDE